MSRVRGKMAEEKRRVLKENIEEMKELRKLGGPDKKKEVAALMKDLASGHLRGDPEAIMRSMMRKKEADKRKQWSADRRAEPSTGKGVGH
jgi:hypothetical protein